MNLYFRRDGTPYPEGESGMLEWAKDMSDMSKKIVKQEYLENGLWISTVWLGLNHAFDLQKKPVIFETMVFKRKKGQKNLGDDIDQKRACTEEDALEVHERMKKKYENFNLES